MRSSEVARIADVSVRTLRHYHAMGLLAEPPRHANGYRDYGAADLARVLHIKRLAALGFSLSRIKGMLDGDAAEAAEASDGLGVAAGAAASGAALEAQALDELDRELELQIERLQEQRRIVALLRREQLDPALPVDFARTVKRFFDSERMRTPKGIAQADRSALMIAGQFYSAQDIAELERVAMQLNDLGLMEDLFDVQQRIDGLAPDASEAERAALVADSEALIGAVADCLDPANWEDDADDGLLGLLTDSLRDDALNPAQRDVEERVNRIIADRVALKRAAANP